MASLLRAPSMPSLYGPHAPHILLAAVASRRGEAATPPPTPPPVQAPEAPQDIPTYFQAAPEPQVYQAVPQYSSLPQPPAPKAALPPLVYIGIGEPRHLSTPGFPALCVAFFAALFPASSPQPDGKDT
jgi:hypothetical protein